MMLMPPAPAAVIILSAVDQTRCCDSDASPLKLTLASPPTGVGLWKSDILLDAPAVRVASEYRLRPLVASCEISDR